MRLLSCVPLLLAAFGAFAAPAVCELRADEELVFYPTLAWPSPDGSGWEVRVRGSVVEREKMRLTLATLRVALRLDGVKMSKAELATFKDRARLFFADNERGHRVVVQIADQTFDLGESAPNGHFEKQIRIAAPPLFAIPALAGSGTGAQASDRLKPGLQTDPGFWEITAVLKPGDARKFTGTVLALPRAGVSVISDVDDTIKLSDVLDHRAMLRRTFLEPFQAVPGMAEVYRVWATNGVAFHYVSASPWQLFQPLREFAGTNGFPQGSWSMKQWRLKDRSFKSLFEKPERYKVETLAPLLRQFPGRRFVLVGDSGERDPEAYATLAREFPAQVKAIFIRDVTGQGMEAERYRTNFSGLPGGLWRVFTEPSEIGRVEFLGVPPTSEAEK